MNTQPLPHGTPAILTLSDTSAAGSDASITLPANGRYEILMINVAVVTDANAANRRVGVTITAGGTVPPFINWNADQTAATTNIYNSAPTYDQSVVTKTHPAVNDTLYTGMPPLILEPSDVIATNIGNIQVGDIAILVIVAKRWTL